MPILRIPGPRFYSLLDEDLFFDYLKSIKGVGKVKGEGAGLLVSVRSPMSGKAVRELDGLFKRYRIKGGSQWGQFKEGV